MADFLFFRKNHFYAKNKQYRSGEFLLPAPKPAILLENSFEITCHDGYKNQDQCALRIEPESEKSDLFLQKDRLRINELWQKGQKEDCDLRIQHIR